MPRFALPELQMFALEIVSTICSTTTPNFALETNLNICSKLQILPWNSLFPRFALPRLQILPDKRPYPRNGLIPRIALPRLQILPDIQFQRFTLPKLQIFTLEIVSTIYSTTTPNLVLKTNPNTYSKRQILPWNSWIPRIALLRLQILP